MSGADIGAKAKKILIMGLDNSGKTSILLSLQRDTNLMSYYSLRPTRGLNIVNFEDHGTIFNIWDFGGQEQYRKSYLQRFNEYFSGVDKIIFVIDVQDTERYDIALQYLQLIINELQKQEYNVDFSIFLHKFDPNLENHPDFTDEKVTSNLLAKIEKIVPPNFEYHLFKTTIFTIFQKRPIIR